MWYLYILRIDGKRVEYEFVEAENEEEAQRTISERRNNSSWYAIYIFSSREKPELLQ